jgi:hypothetical protein
MKQLFVILTVFSVVFAACGDLYEGDPQEGTGSITGIIKTSQNALVTNANVYIQNDLSLFTVSDEQGKFLLDAVPAGNHIVFAFSQDGLGTSTDVTVLGNETSTIELTLSPSATISGRVTLEGESNYLGSLVYLPGTSFAGYTDNDGDFMLLHIVPGCYRLYVEHDGFQPKDLDQVCVEAGSNETLAEITLIKTDDVECVENSDCQDNQECEDNTCRFIQGYQEEICDGQDNDGNGIIDEGLAETCGLDQGICQPGISICLGGAMSECMDDIPPTTEACNDDIDNDCDGETDEDCNGFQLTVVLSGDGAGLVTSNPAGIDCGSECSNNYPEGTTITLYASGAAVGWTNCDDAFSDICTITLDSDKTVTAHFCPIPQYSNNCSQVDYFQCGFEPSCEDGMITINWHEHVLCQDNEIIIGYTCTYNCTDGCRTDYSGWPQNGQVLIEEMCISEGPCKEEGGWFLPGEGECCPGLTTLSTGQGITLEGTCEDLDCGIYDICTNCGDGSCGIGENFCSCPDDCNDNCVQPGGVMVGEQGCCDGSPYMTALPLDGEGCSLHVCTLCGDGNCDYGEDSETCSADCTGFQLTVTLSGDESGSVISNPAGINCGSDCSQIYPAGTRVALQAIGATVYWTDCDEPDEPFSDMCYMTLDADKTVIAHFP